MHRTYPNINIVFQGPLVESSVTGRLEPKESPTWQRRAFRYLVSFPIIALCLVLVFIVTFLMLQLQVKLAIFKNSLHLFERKLMLKYAKLVVHF